MLAEALDTANKTEERWYEAELYHLKRDLILQSRVQSLESGVRNEAEGCFRRAIDIARRQSVKSLELRAVTSLSRLWQQQAPVPHTYLRGIEAMPLGEIQTIHPGRSQPKPRHNRTGDCCQVLLLYIVSLHDSLRFSDFVALSCTASGLTLIKEAGTVF